MLIRVKEFENGGEIWLNPESVTKVTTIPDIDLAMIYTEDGSCADVTISEWEGFARRMHFGNDIKVWDAIMESSEGARSL